MKLLQYLGDSAVTCAFRLAVETFVRSPRPNERIFFSTALPPVKVERILTRILETYPRLAIESVHIEGHSGCQYFRGRVAVRAANEERHVEFDWDCRWKALQMGWVDYFGFPDQTRAALEFGHDCFRGWSEEIVEAGPPTPGRTHQLVPTPSSS